MPGEGRRARGIEGGKLNALFVSGREEGCAKGHRALSLPSLHYKDKQPPTRHAALTFFLLKLSCKGRERGC